MKFFFPDSQDQVDPYFDFRTETTADFRVRQRDDRYAHEVLKKPAYDGLLVSKPIVDGLPGASGKYTMAQRHRLYRLGVRRFFRLDQRGWNLAAMGDCGSFTYIKEEEPPYSVSDVIDFYDGCGFDYGISVDHVVFGYDPEERSNDLAEWMRRQKLTLKLAAEFLEEHAHRDCTFTPLGAAQGWSPDSYAEAVAELQRLGYTYIAMGGMVPLKAQQILDCLRAVNEVRQPDVSLHLLGVSRPAILSELSALGVASLDSTSPFRQAFKDATDNYYWWDRNFAALRVPQIDANARLKAAIRAGRVDQDAARRLERRCLDCLRQYEVGKVGVDAVVDALHSYAQVHGDRLDRRRQAADLLTASPWRDCDCDVCDSVGIEVVIFRGTERNKRRGFHNLHIFRATLDSATPIAAAQRLN